MLAWYIANQMKRKSKPKCPKCSSKDFVVPIVYGFPGNEMQKEYNEEKIELGGCLIEEDAPDWYCKECENHY